MFQTDQVSSGLASADVVTSRFNMNHPPDLKPGRYRHFKGNEYEVIGVARDSETLQTMVVYRALYGEHGLWVRPLGMFTEMIERDGQRMPRFQYVGEG